MANRKKNGIDSCLVMKCHWAKIGRVLQFLLCCSSWKEKTLIALKPLMEVLVMEASYSEKDMLKTPQKSCELNSI